MTSQEEKLGRYKILMKNGESVEISADRVRTRADGVRLMIGEEVVAFFTHDISGWYKIFESEEPDSTS